MIVKPRKEPAELSMLKLLDARMSLSSEQKRYYYNLKKGYEGELQFDSLVEKLQCDCLILNDLLLKVNNTTFQVDSFIITEKTIYFFEIKNYEGDYYYESDRFYQRSKTERLNPLGQLSRSESLLRQLLQSLGYQIPLDASVVFINEEFTLYQTPINIPFIFSTQINRYFKQLNEIPAKLTRKHTILAEKLQSLHIEKSPFTQLPSYDYDQLRKGITCCECNSLAVSVEGRKCVCSDCGHEEFVEDAVIRSTDEFKLLFPEEKITTSIVHDWCEVVSSKKAIRRILSKQFQKVSKNRWSYYENNKVRS